MPTPVEDAKKSTEQAATATALANLGDRAKRMSLDAGSSNTGYPLQTSPKQTYAPMTSSMGYVPGLQAVCHFEKLLLRFLLILFY